LLWADPEPVQRREYRRVRGRQGAELGLQRVDAPLAVVQLPAEVGRAVLLALQGGLRFLGGGRAGGYRDVRAPHLAVVQPPQVHRPGA
jgi:hypothetical protein